MLVEGEKRREVHQVSESSKSVSAADFRERWRRVWAEGSLGIILEPTFDLRVEGGLEEGGGEEKSGGGCGRGGCFGRGGLRR